LENAGFKVHRLESLCYHFSIVKPENLNPPNILEHQKDFFSNLLIFLMVSRPLQILSGKGIIFFMSKFFDIYKKPFFACAICVIYTAVSLGIALFGF